MFYYTSIPKQFKELKYLQIIMYRITVNRNKNPDIFQYFYLFLLCLDNTSVVLHIAIQTYS